MKTRGRTGISKFAIPVALIVIIVVVAGAYILIAGRPTTSSSQTSSTSLLPTVQVQTDVNQLIQSINDRDVDGLLNFYTQGAVVTWSGPADGLVGSSSGGGNIRLLYAASIGKTTTMVANISNYAQNAISPTNINATFNLVMHANSTAAGIVNATINVSEDWNWNGIAWQISKENWVYTHFSASFLNAGSVSATTFPQWAVMEKGGNPNIVSEKSFEWHVGPYLAAGVYAFLFSIISVVVVRSRSRYRETQNQNQRRAPTTS